MLFPVEKCKPNKIGIGLLLRGVEGWIIAPIARLRETIETFLALSVWLSAEGSTSEGSGLAGHKTIQMTMRYAHLAPGGAKSAAEALCKRPVPPQLPPINLVRQKRWQFTLTKILHRLVPGTGIEPVRPSRDPGF
jgi:hypothetical protein